MSETYGVCDKCNRINRVRLDDQKKPVCGACKTELAIHGAVNDGHDQNLQTLINKCPLPVVVDVWAPWCGPCRQFAPAFSEFSQSYANKIVFVKLNSDENPQMASKWGIRSIPTLIFFKNGREVTRQLGALPREDFGRWLDQNL